MWLPKKQPPPDCSGYVLSKMQTSTRKLNWGIHLTEWNVLPIPVPAWTSWLKTFWPWPRCRVDAFQASITGSQCLLAKLELSSMQSDCSAELPCLPICIDSGLLAQTTRAPKSCSLVGCEVTISLGGLILLGKDLLPQFPKGNEAWAIALLVFVRANVFPSEQLSNLLAKW